MLAQNGATLNDILNGPKGYVWIEEACGGDREPRLQVSLKSCEIEGTPATLGARLVDTAPRIEPSALYSARFSG